MGYTMSLIILPSEIVAFGARFPAPSILPGLTAGPIDWRPFGPLPHLRRSVPCAIILPGLTAGPIDCRPFGPLPHIRRSVPCTIHASRPDGRAY
jgi:hypothetical protein